MKEKTIKNARNREIVYYEHDDDVIILKLNGGYTIFDTLYFSKVVELSWHVHETGYINHSMSEYSNMYIDERISNMYLHKFIMKYCAKVPNPEDKPQIDHINRNKFDNYKSVQSLI